MAERERALEPGRSARHVTSRAIAGALAILVLVALAAVLAGVRVHFDPWGPVAPSQTDGGAIAGFAFALVSGFGSGIGLVAITGAAVLGLARVGRRSEATFVAVAVFGAVIVSRVLKYYFHAPRPAAPDLVAGTTNSADLLVAVAVAVTIGLVLLTRWRVWVVGGVAVAGAALAIEWLIGRALPLTASFDAFPSGHAFYSMTLASALAPIAWRSVRARAPILAAISLYVVAVGVSRVYLHAHYPADVAAGWCFALAWTAGLGSAWMPIVRPALYRAADWGRRLAH